MQIDKHILFGSFTRFDHVSIIQKGYSSDYSQFRTVTKAEDFADVASTIYITNLKGVEKIDGAPHCFVYADDAPPRWLVRPCDGLVWICTKEDLTFITCQLSNCLLELQQWYSETELLTARLASLTEISQRGYQLLGMPFIIFDGGFRVLSYTEKAVTEYPLYLETIEKGYSSAEVMKKAKENHFLQEVNHSEQALIKEALAQESQRNIYKKMTHKGTIISYCVIFCEDKDIHPAFLDLCELLFCFIKKCLSFEKDSIQQNNYMYESFLIELMTDPNVHEERIRERLQYLPDIPYNAEFILIQVKAVNTETFPVRYLYYDLESIFTRSKMVIYKEDIYLLCIHSENLKDRNKNIERIVQDLQRITSSYEVFLSMSNPFTELQKLHYAYIQCNRTIEISPIIQTGKSMFYYKDIFLYHFFQQAAQEIELSSICSPQFEELKKIGEENGVDYLSILYSYLKNERRASVCAIELNLHRNTVLYHIQNIQKSLEISFDDINTRMHFLISFHIMDWEKRCIEHELPE